MWARKIQGLSLSCTQVNSASGQINVAHASVCQQFVSSIQNHCWKLGQQTPSVGTILAYLETKD